MLELSRQVLGFEVGKKEQPARRTFLVQNGFQVAVGENLR